MCLACEQDSIWLAYLESRGLLKPDDPAAIDEFFAAFPVQELPVQELPAQPVEGEQPAQTPEQVSKNPFSCDDPTVG